MRCTSSPPSSGSVLQVLYLDGQGIASHLHSLTLIPDKAEKHHSDIIRVCCRLAASYLGPAGHMWTPACLSQGDSERMRRCYRKTTPAVVNNAIWFQLKLEDGTIYRRPVYRIPVGLAFPVLGRAPRCNLVEIKILQCCSSPI